MTIIISDSSPLIYLAKLNKLDLIKDIYKKILIPREVYQEIVMGDDSNKEEIVLIESLIESKFIQIKEVKKIKKEIKSLHKGELKAINLCFNEKIKDILIDDKEAYGLCKLFNLNPIRTTALLLECVKRKLIKKEEYKELLIQLSEEGYFLTLNVFEYLMGTVENMKIGGKK